MQHDPWLDRWLPQLQASAGTRPVLEIGCGSGADTATLAAAGLSVVAFDLSADAAAVAQQRVPAARVTCQDVRDAFPLGAGEAGVVVASLSLHYFPWSDTVRLLQRVHDVLAPDGLLLCRLNSTEDVHFGAQGHPAIEPNYHLVDGQPKRFFDEAGIDALFARGWLVRSKQHLRTDKYGPPKALWEIVAQRVAAVD